MTRFLLVCAGGALGTGARYLLAGMVLRGCGTLFPWGTWAVNILGSFLLSLILQLSLNARLLSPDLRIALTTGLLGGFTTYSTFNYETLGYLEAGNYLWAVVNVAVTLFACLAASVLGLWLARWIAGI